MTPWPPVALEGPPVPAEDVMLVNDSSAMQAQEITNIVAKNFINPSPGVYFCNMSLFDIVLLLMFALAM
jgi:hypothetical protein